MAILCEAFDLFKVARIIIVITVSFPQYKDTIYMCLSDTFSKRD